MFFSDNAKWKQEENGSSPHTHCICSSCTDRTNRAVCKIHYYAQDIATVRFSEYILYWTKSLPLPISEALPGGSHVARLNFKTARVGVYKNACRLLLALLSPSQFGRGRLSLVTISFYALLLLFGSCRLSEFTLAGPHWFDWDQIGGWFT